MLERYVLEALHPTTHQFLSRNGITYVVHEGPPWPSFSDIDSSFDTPDEPHVIEVSDFSLTADVDNHTLLGITDSSIRVLDIHGVWKSNQWYPRGTRFQKNWITIPDIVEDYESKTGKTIDVITACRGNDSLKSSGPVFRTPKIYMQRGRVSGSTMTRYDTGGLSVTMHVLDQGEVQYEGWIEQNRSRLGAPAFV